MTALHHVLAQRPDSISSAIPTIEFVDVTEVAAALGLRCRMSMSPALLHTIDVDATLRRFRDVLTTTWRDPALSLLRTIALSGVHVPVPLTVVAGFQEAREAVRFLERVHAGLSGVSDDGRILAIPAVLRPAPGGAPPAHDDAPAPADERIAVFTPWLVPVVHANPRPPLLIVNSLEDTAPDQILERFRIELKDVSNRK